MERLQLSHVWAELAASAAGSCVELQLVVLLWERGPSWRKWLTEGVTLGVTLGL